MSLLSWYVITTSAFLSGTCLGILIICMVIAYTEEDAEDDADGDDHG